MKNLLYSLVDNDVVVRAAKTFVQAFLAVFLVSDNPVNKEVLIAAVAAGVSAVWNSVRGLRS
jgi:hypothetical protein